MFKAAADQGIGFYAQILSEQACSLQLDLYHEVACSLLDSEPEFSVFSFQSFPL